MLIGHLVWKSSCRVPVRIATYLLYGVHVVNGSVMNFEGLCLIDWNVLISVFPIRVSPSLIWTPWQVFTPRKLACPIRPLTRIGEALGLNPGRDTDYSDWPVSVFSSSGKCWDFFRSLTHPYQFAIHYHPLVRGYKSLELQESTFWRDVGYELAPPYCSVVSTLMFRLLGCTSTYIYIYIYIYILRRREDARKERNEKEEGSSFIVLLFYCLFLGARGSVVAEAPYH
jgi:hypothetical protein